MKSAERPAHKLPSGSRLRTQDSSYAHPDLGKSKKKKMNSTRRDSKLDFFIEDQLGLQLRIKEVTALTPSFNY
jgi:hypothetical protein